ncbi:MAG: hypothetical protein ACP5GZ_03375 [Vulcanisaeta sp.]|uniref:hypothetical protein n=1 Tax=Vulcanisaeta sp. TaxID=2020871 RepID=UPI003D102603
MARDTNLSQISGVPNCTLIVLCEGDNDLEFVRGLLMRIGLNCEVRRQGPRDKDSVIRLVIDSKQLSHVPVIVEGGKDRLDGNVRVLVSKLRSVRGSYVRVLVLRDSDSDDAISAFSKLKSSIDGIINNKTKFPLYKPTMRCDQGRSIGPLTIYNCILVYKDGDACFQFVYIVPSLERFLSGYGYTNNKSSLNQAINNALNDLEKRDIVNYFRNYFHNDCEI